MAVEWEDRCSCEVEEQAWLWSRRICVVVVVGVVVVVEWGKACGCRVEGKGRSCGSSEGKFLPMARSGLDHVLATARSYIANAWVQHWMILVPLGVPPSNLIGLHLSEHAPYKTQLRIEFGH